MGRKAMNKILIKNAHLISMDDNIGDLLDTDILINDGIIERVEPSICLLYTSPSPRDS